jgi:hypothetical protein
MAKYLVVGYLTTNVSVYVEAKNMDDARDLGYELLTDGMGIHGDSAWDEEFDVIEEEN